MFLSVIPYVHGVYEVELYCARRDAALYQHCQHTGLKSYFAPWRSAAARPGADCDSSRTPPDSPCSRTSGVPGPLAPAAHAASASAQLSGGSNLSPRIQ